MGSSALNTLNTDTAPVRATLRMRGNGDPDIIIIPTWDHIRVVLSSLPQRHPGSLTLLNDDGFYLLGLFKHLGAIALREVLVFCFYLDYYIMIDQNSALEYQCINDVAFIHWQLMHKPHLVTSCGFLCCQVHESVFKSIIAFMFTPADF